MTSIIADLRRVPPWAACGLVLLALLVLAVRAGALLVLLGAVLAGAVADVAIRAETAATARAGIAPLAATTFTPGGDW